MISEAAGVVERATAARPPAKVWHLSGCTTRQLPTALLATPTVASTIVIAKSGESLLNAKCAWLSSMTTMHVQQFGDDNHARLAKGAGEGNWQVEYVKTGWGTSGERRGQPRMAKFDVPFFWDDNHARKCAEPRHLHRDEGGQNRTDKHSNRTRNTRNTLAMWITGISSRNPGPAGRNGAGPRGPIHEP